MHWIYLTFAICAEIIGSSAIKLSEGFTKPGPTAIGLLGFALALYLLSLTLKVLPLGITYAIWAGVGIVLVTLISWLVMGEKIDLPALLGIALIVSGVLVINLFSKAVPH